MGCSILCTDKRKIKGIEGKWLGVDSSGRK